MPTIEGAENFPDMMLPNLIVPGAAKSGTTSLHESLQEHPDIFMCRRKEPHFFSREASLDDQRRYEMLFERADRFPMRGESSTSYMVIPDAPRRIERLLDRPKFIFVLRNPVERVVSHYRWLQSLGLEARPLRRAFLADRDEIPSMDRSILDSGNYPYYYQHSTYGTALERYLACFDRSQIKIVTFEHFVADHEATMRECFAFLGVREDVFSNDGSIERDSECNLDQGCGAFPAALQPYASSSLHPATSESRLGTCASGP